MTPKQFAAILITYHEGFSARTYRDPIKPEIITVGWGTTHIDGQPVVMSEREYSRAECMGYLENYLDIAINTLCPSMPSFMAPWEVGAILSLAYNEGLTAIFNSTLMSHLKMQDMMKAAVEFPRWCYAGGVMRESLLDRRRSEMLTFLSGEFAFNPTEDYRMLRSPTRRIIYQA